MSIGHPEWQAQIRQRLVDNQAHAEGYREIIQQYGKLAKSARDLKTRNKTLMKTGGGGGGEADGSNPLLKYLDQELTSLRSEISELYRSQAATQNKQLASAELLRERDEEVMNLRDEMRNLRDARDRLERKDQEWEQRWKAREVDMVTLSDEVMSLNLEISGISKREKALMADNANLLQRWIDKMNSQADMMNEDFEREKGGLAFAELKGDGEEGDAFEFVSAAGSETGDDETTPRKEKPKPRTSRPTSATSTTSSRAPPPNAKVPAAPAAKPTTTRTSLAPTAPRTAPRTSSTSKPPLPPVPAEKQSIKRSLTPRSSRPSLAPSPTPSTASTATTATQRTVRKPSGVSEVQKKEVTPKSTPDKDSPRARVTSQTSQVARRSPSSHSLGGKSVRDKIKAMEGSGTLKQPLPSPPKTGSTSPSKGKERQEVLRDSPKKGEGFQ
ncbi:hypothetical protein L198_06836 [Cryptococcus wingfieldii CBS 7118]|uniref:Autophagy-related protein 16 domain-containing protein n=1 Tax=Cryptococcus wingfieldii CBS 7118 TaxID=1295528 RepID=A0A1E3IHR7_9TREE|nr:hypothetical protein L198_06836 [Cryptococcus wingfieldii CBS 7118]ODN88078.1 hypothetical protein L198_06836 [Cryptococcus wingfieldii CBS 7118]